MFKPLGRWFFGDVMIIQIDKNSFLVGSKVRIEPDKFDEFKSQADACCQPFKELNPRAKFVYFAGPIDFEAQNGRD